MPEKKIKADYATIAMAKHDKRDLIKFFEKISPKSKKEELKKLSKMDLVLKIADQHSAEEIEEKWKNNLFAANLSVLYVNFFDRASEEEDIKGDIVDDGISRIAKNIQRFTSLIDKNSYPELTQRPKLIKISRLKNDRYLFMFGKLGKIKFVPIEFEYKKFHEPVFHYCVWDNRTSVLEIRTPSNT